MTPSPLVIVTAYNRPGATKRCLHALDETTDFAACTVVVVDDCSEIDAWELVRRWAKTHQSDKVYAMRMPENGGTARALNYAIKALREPGQPVIKIDNDVEILTPAWNVLVGDLVAALARTHDVATVRAWRTYKGSDMPGETGIAQVYTYRGHGLYLAKKNLGYAVWYTGTFMDRVGYFESLSADHRYGFDDVIMAQKAQILRWQRFIWKGWQVRDQARGTAVEDKDGHIARARPLLKARLTKLRRTGSVRADADGRPSRRI